MSLSDREVSAEIIECCRQGDRAGFHALYQAYKDKVYSISLYFFHGDEAAASDATQQVFLKLITGIGRFRGDSEFSTWLYRMVVNTCLDSAKAGRRRGPLADAAKLAKIAAPASAEAGSGTGGSRRKGASRAVFLSAETSHPGAASIL